jgi:hypothetical protein
MLGFFKQSTFFSYQTILVVLHQAIKHFTPIIVLLCVVVAFFLHQGIKSYKLGVGPEVALHLG